MAISRKDQIDTLQKLCDFHLSRVASRHAIEWRITFGAWAALIAVALRVDRLPVNLLAAFLPIFWLVFIVMIHRLASKNMAESFPMRASITSARTSNPD